jgi:N-acetylglucosaminyl-diphospho-decaprenol L-rhamnosyltransferase
MPKLAVVIVNHNTAALLAKCLETLQRSVTSFDFSVYVVDNASTDGSTVMVRTRFPWVHLIESRVNGGFAYANNLALRELFPDATSRPMVSYVALLNPDTELPPTALQHLVDFLDARPDVAVVGPKLVRPDGSLDLACRRSFPEPEVAFYKMVGLSRLFPKSRRFGRYNLTYLDPDEETEVDAVVAACMVLRAAAVQQVGLLDERFFMYGEDLDWAYRLKQAGWKIYYYPKVTVLHHKGAASRRSRRATYEFYRAMLLFYRKHYAAHTNGLLHLIIISGIFIKAAASLLASLARPAGLRRIG